MTLKVIMPVTFPDGYDLYHFVREANTNIPRNWPKNYSYMANSYPNEWNKKTAYGIGSQSNSTNLHYCQYPHGTKGYYSVESNSFAYTPNTGQLMVYGLDYGPYFFYELIKPLDGSQGDQPDITPNVWLKYREVNHLAFANSSSGIFSYNVNSKIKLTPSVSEIVIVISPNLYVSGMGPPTVAHSFPSFDTIGFYEVDCQSAKIELVTPADNEGTYSASGAVVHTATYNKTQAEDATSWWDYYWGDLAYSTVEANSFMVGQIPSAAGKFVRITLTGATRVGKIVFGSVYEIGCLRHGVKTRLIDYTKRTTDDYGNITIARRMWANEVSANLLINKSDLNNFQDKMRDLRGKSTIWYGSDEDEYASSLIVFGYHLDVSASIDYPDESLVSIKIQSLASE